MTKVIPPPQEGGGHTPELTTARQNIIESAALHKPAAWIVSATGGRIGHERSSWKRNCEWLVKNGLLYANGHGDYTLTYDGEDLREQLTAARSVQP